VSNFFGQLGQERVHVAVGGLKVDAHFGQETGQDQIELGAEVLVRECSLFVEGQFGAEEVLVLEEGELALQAVGAHGCLEFSLCLGFVFELGLHLLPEVLQLAEFGKQLLCQQGQDLHHQLLLLVATA